MISKLFARRFLALMTTLLGVTMASSSSSGLIKRFEDFRASAYADSAGNPTIGYGHLLVSGEDALAAATLTEEQATELLEADIASKADISKIITPDAWAYLEPHQSDALTSLCFNIGSGNFTCADVVARVNAGDVMGAVEYFGHWRRVGRTILPGLIKRRLAEACIFADCELDPAGDVPSTQWGLGEMAITDENWGRVGEDLRTEAVKIFKEYKSDAL